MSSSVGASGVLGSAVFAAFKQAGHTTLGLANSRSSDELKKLDLLDKPEVEKVFKEFTPNCKSPLAVYSFNNRSSMHLKG